MKKLSINKNALQSILKKQGEKIINSAAEKIIRKRVMDAKQVAMQELNSHPVTQEIDSGPDGYNQSGTLNGYGNLFSYIGFDEGSDPIAPIRALLHKAVNIKSVPARQRNMISNFIVELPSKEDFFNATPMPWADGRSWAEGIERGISGLGQYLHGTSLSNNSRSGSGVQTKNNLRSGRFKNTKYLSNILNNLRKAIEGGSQWI